MYTITKYEFIFVSRVMDEGRGSGVIYIYCGTNHIYTYWQTVPFFSDH